jgi:DNA-binding HxlR family transcriptional regulator
MLAWVVISQLSCSGMSTDTLDLDPRLQSRRGPAPDCSIDRALQVLSTRSAMLLLREAFYGVTRFDELVARVGISEPVAAARLKELVAEGLLVREPYREPGQRTRHAYRLTEKGFDILPALVSLLQWGDRWTSADGGGPVALTHVGCGEPVHAELRCGAGHLVPTAPELHAEATDAGIRRRRTSPSGC